MDQTDDLTSLLLRQDSSHGIVQLVQHWKVVRSSGLTLQQLLDSDQEEAELMLAVETARSLHFLNRLKAIVGRKEGGDVKSAKILTLLAEYFIGF